MDSKLDSIAEFLENEREALRKLDERVDTIERQHDEINRKMELIFQNNEKVLALSNEEITFIEDMIKETKKNLDNFNSRITEAIEDKLSDLQKSSNSFISETAEKSNSAIKELLAQGVREISDLQKSSNNSISEAAEKSNSAIKELLEQEVQKISDMEINSTKDIIGRINELNKGLSEDIGFINDEIRMILLNTVMDQI